MKWRDSAEAFQLLFKASIDAARLELRASQADRDEGIVKELAAAVLARDRARATLEAAIAKDARSQAEHAEEFGGEELGFAHLGPAN